VTAEQLRAAFDAPAPFTIGLEEEVLLCDPGTLDLAPVAREVVERACDPRIKLELPAAQVELMTRPHPTVDDAIAELADARRTLAAAADGLAVPIAAAAHPTADPEGVLNTGARYDEIGAEYASIARRQLVGSLQVHVAVGGADRTLAVYNGLRPLLPLLAALAACAPFHGGRDTGLASVRPAICDLLPRQGVPPAIPDWDWFARELAWGAAAGRVPEPRLWWWELRPHPAYGTLELRVPDTQPTMAMAAAVAGVAHALVRRLAEREDAGEPPPAWRIEENRWSALRHGVEGEMADLTTGARRPTRELLHALISDVEAHAPHGLDDAHALAERNGAMQLREQGLDGATRWLSERFLG
jgi:glutamate---cysteine ligase / carboxylate-amine ligase